MLLCRFILLCFQDFCALMHAYAFILFQLAETFSKNTFLHLWLPARARDSSAIILLCAHCTNWKHHMRKESSAHVKRHDKCQNTKWFEIDFLLALKCTHQEFRSRIRAHRTENLKLQFWEILVLTFKTLIGIKNMPKAEL